MPRSNEEFIRSDVGKFDQSRVFQQKMDFFKIVSVILTWTNNLTYYTRMSWKTRDSITLRSYIAQRLHIWNRISPIKITGYRGKTLIKLSTTSCLSVVTPESVESSYVFYLIKFRFTVFIIPKNPYNSTYKR